MVYGKTTHNGSVYAPQLRWGRRLWAVRPPQWLAIGLKPATSYTDVNVRRNWF
jgi:hypothetical protein